MIKKLSACLISSFLLADMTLATEDQREGKSCKKRAYWDLQELYWSVSESELDQRTKAVELQDISDRMSKLCKIENEDYNKCMRESNKQQRSDYDRCDRNKKGDKCYNRADKNNSDRRGACERVAHSDNAKETAKARR